MTAEALQVSPYNSEIQQVGNPVKKVGNLVIQISSAEENVAEENVNLDLQMTADKVANFTAGVFKQKEENIVASVTGKNKIFERFNIFLIGNDIFTLGYLGIQSLGLLIPSLGATKAMVSICSVCGVIAGIFMFPIGIFDLRAGLLKIRNGGEGPNGILLTLTGITEIAISAVLILSSVAAACVAFGSGGAGMVAIAGFFAANPWVLPLLLLIPSVFSLIEICRKLHLARTGQDPYGQLKLDTLKTNIANYKSHIDYMSNITLTPIGTKEEAQKNLVKSIATFLNTFYGISIPENKQNASDIIQSLTEELKQKLIEEEVSKEIKKHEERLEYIIKLLQKKQQAKTLPPPEETTLRTLIENIDTDLNDVDLKETEEGKYLHLVFNKEVFNNGKVIDQVLLKKYLAQEQDCIVLDFIKIEKGTPYFQYLCEKHKQEKFDKLPLVEKETLLAKFVSQRVEDLTEGMGLDGAINAGNLINPLLTLLTMIKDNNPDGQINAFLSMKNPALHDKTIIGQVGELQKNKKVWVGVLIARLTIQLLYVLGFGASMGTLALSTSAPAGRPSPANISTAIQNILLCGPQAISLFLDIVFAFIRGLPVVTDPVLVGNNKDPKTVTIGFIEQLGIELAKKQKEKLEKEEEEKRRLPALAMKSSESTIESAASHVVVSNVPPQEARIIIVP